MVLQALILKNLSAFLVRSIVDSVFVLIHPPIAQSATKSA